jgi:hypothetical protein
MAAAVEGPEDEIKKIEGGMTVKFQGTGTPTIVTFTEVDPDAFKLTFHQVLRDREHDLLCRNTDTTSSESVYDDQCIIVRKNLHVTRNTAKKIWDSFKTDEEFMSQPQRNEDGKRFSQLTTYLQDPVIAAIHYLERIAWSVYDKDKRQAAAAAAAARAEQRRIKAEASEARRKELEATQEYRAQMEMARLTEEQEDAAAAAAAAAKRDARDKPPVGPRVRKPTGSSGGTRRPSRKYKKSKRVLRRKSRSTRRR